MMNNDITIENFKKHTKRIKDNIILFPQAIFYPQMLLYFIYRTRYFFITNLFHIIIHIAEFYLLTSLFSSENLKPLLLLKALSFIIEPLWWGMLEQMRERIREHHQQKDTKALAKELGNWHFLSLIFISIFLIICILFLFYAFTNGPESRLFNLYSAAVFAQIAVVFYIGTLRAGIYALYRIYRPLLSMLLPPILSLIFLLGLYIAIGPFAIILGVIFQTVFNGGLSYYFIYRTCNFYQWPSLIWPKWKNFFIFLKILINSQFTSATLASIFMNIEGIVLWFLFYVAQPKSVPAQFYLIFYFIAPLFQATCNWPKLFYFDIKKYDSNLLQDFFKPFHHKILYLSPMLGFFMWLISALLSMSYFQYESYIFNAFAAIFFTINSIIVYLQMIAFCQKKYLGVAISGIFFTLSISMFLINMNLYVQIFMMFLFISIRFFYIFSLRKNLVLDKKNFYTQISFKEWVENLKKATLPYMQKVRLVRLEIFPATNTKLKQELNHYLFNLKLFENNYFWLDEFTLIAFGSFEDNEINQIFIHCSNILKNYQLSSVFTNGLEVLQSKESQKFLDTCDFRHAPKNVIYFESGEELKEKFYKFFPYGLCWNSDKPKLNKMLQKYFVDDKNNSRFFFHLLKQVLVSPLSKQDGDLFSVSIAYYEKNKPLIFVIPKCFENKERIWDWKYSVFLWNLREITQN